MILRKKMETMTLREKMETLNDAIEVIRNEGEKIAYRLWNMFDGYSDYYERIREVINSVIHTAKIAGYKDFGTFTFEEFIKAMDEGEVLEEISVADAFRYVNEVSRESLLKRFTLEMFEAVTDEPFPVDPGNDFITGGLTLEKGNGVAFLADMSYKYGEDVLKKRRLIASVNLRDFSQVHFPSVTVTPEIEEQRKAVTESIGKFADVFDAYGTTKEGFLERYPRYSANVTKPLAVIVLTAGGEFFKWCDLNVPEWNLK